MQFDTINGFDDFCTALRRAGFAMGGSNSEGIFSLNPYWGASIEGHTGSADTDPWEWRIKAVRDCDDLAYGKLFFRKGGYLTKEWYPCFLAVRRKGLRFEEMYENGLLSSMEKSIYQVIKSQNEASLYEIKRALACKKSQNYEFQVSLESLQSKMLITVCNEKQKLSQAGLPYGWPVTSFCLADDFFGDGVFTASCDMDEREAAEQITGRIHELNPQAREDAIRRFIHG